MRSATPSCVAPTRVVFIVFQASDKLMIYILNNTGYWHIQTHDSIIWKKRIVEKHAVVCACVGCVHIHRASGVQSAGHIGIIWSRHCEKERKWYDGSYAHSLAQLSLEADRNSGVEYSGVCIHHADLVAPMKSMAENLLFEKRWWTVDCRLALFRWLRFSLEATLWVWLFGKWIILFPKTEHECRNYIL